MLLLLNFVNVLNNLKLHIKPLSLIKSNRLYATFPLY